MNELDELIIYLEAESVKVRAEATAHSSVAQAGRYDGLREAMDKAKEIKARRCSPCSNAARIACYMLTHNHGTESR